MNIKSLPNALDLKPKTKELYKRALSAVLSGSDLSAQNIENSFLRLIEQQKTTKEPLSNKTLNLYRSAIKHWLNEQIQFLKDNDLDCSVETEILKKITSTKVNLKDEIIGVMRKVGRKNFSRSIIYKLKDENRGERKNGLLFFLEANLITGLRPTEWFSAGLCSNVVDKRLCLVVKNAKYSKERGIGHGEFRYLGLSELSPTKRAIIERYLDFIAIIFDKHKNRPDKYYHQLNVEFNRFKKQNGITSKETLRSTRHQLIANMKASGYYTSADIADIVGHVSEATARHHYGPRKNGVYGEMPVKAKALMNHYELKAEKKLENQISNSLGFQKKSNAVAYEKAILQISESLRIDLKIGVYSEQGSPEQIEKIHNISMACLEVENILKAKKNISLDMDMG